MKQIYKESILYVATAMIGNIIDFSLFLGLQHIGLSIIFSQWIAALIGNTHNFLWQFFVIFDHNQKVSKSYILTISLAVFLIFLSGPLIALFDNFLQNPTVSKLIIFPTIGTIGFFARKYLIFKKS